MMAKKMSISKDAHDLYVKHYGDDYDESVYPSIRSMTAVIATNASRIMDKTPTYHPWKMTYRNFYMAYTDGRFTMNGAEIPVPLDVKRMLIVVWTIMQVVHPEYPWSDDDD